MEIIRGGETRDRASDLASCGGDATVGYTGRVVGRGSGRVILTAWRGFGLNLGLPKQFDIDYYVAGHSWICGAGFVAALQGVISTAGCYMILLQSM